MRRMRRLAASVMLMAVLGFGLAVVVPSPARGAGSAPVTVMNTAAQPVPVALQGTGAIAGSVNALQSGPWDVSVLNLPAVQIATGTSVAISSTPTTPVFTSDVAGRNAYAVDLRACLDAACSSGPHAPSISPPVGTRFVIQQVSGTCNALSANLQLRLNNHVHTHWLEIGPNYDPFSSPVTLYADGGLPNAVSLLIYGNNVECNVGLVGYLIQMDSF